MTTATHIPETAKPSRPANESQPKSNLNLHVTQYTALASDTAAKAREAAELTANAAQRAAQLMAKAQDAAESAVFTPGRRSPDVRTCRQQAKANVLEARALSMSSRARRAAEIAERASNIARRAAHQAEQAADLIPMGPGWYDSWTTAENARTQADQAEEAAAQARQTAASLPF